MHIVIVVIVWWVVGSIALIQLFRIDGDITLDDMPMFVFGGCMGLFALVMYFWATTDTRRVIFKKKK